MAYFELHIQEQGIQAVKIIEREVCVMQFCCYCS